MFHDYNKYDHSLLNKVDTVYEYPNDSAEYVYDYRGYKIVRTILIEDDCTHDNCRVYFEDKLLFEEHFFNSLDRSCVRIDEIISNGKDF